MSSSSAWSSIPEVPDLGYSEKQRLLALLNLQVHLEEDWRVAAFLPGP